MSERYEIVSVKDGKYHRPTNPVFERDASVLRTPRPMLCGRALVPLNFFETTDAANKHTGGRLSKFACNQCEAAYGRTKELPKHYYQIGDSLPASAGCIMPHSEVCMSMRIAGKAMGWKILDARMVQLYDAKGEEFSAPILLGEAGFYQDGKGIYRNDGPAPPERDVVVRNEGSVYGFYFLTDRVRAWVDENVQREGWQWMGPVLYVDWRPAQTLIEGLREAGFDVSVCVVA